MPAIFDEEARAAMRASMLAAGLDIMSEKGGKQPTVSEVTRRAGIAKGTFYSFFPSKADYYYEVLMQGRVKVAQELERVAEEAGGALDRAGFKAWLLRSWALGGPFYRAIGLEGWQYLVERCPDDQAFDGEEAKGKAAWVLSKLAGLSPKADWKVFANLQSSIALVYLHTRHIHQDALEDTVEALVEAECRCLFDA